MKDFLIKNKFFAFLLGWTILSLIQAGVTGLNEDEAYYWMWSQHLDWGFFDHPPAVALQIAIGQIFGNTKLTLRLMTALLNAGAIYFLWQIVSDYTRDPKLFWLAIVSFPLIHIYAFVTTPDAALFFFSTAFFYFYKKYLDEDSWKNTALVTICIALMFYSKYHAILLVGFTVFSNLKLLTRKSFWVIAFGSIALLFPHIFWQIENDSPSIRYHLFERSKSAYRFDFTTAYLMNQFLVLGPLTAFFMLKSAYKTAAPTYFEKALKWNFYGVLIFFFASSLKGWVEPHWTYAAVIPISILGIKGLSENEKFKNLFFKFALPSLALLFIVRIMLVLPGPWSKVPALKKYYHGTEWAKTISNYAGEKPVIFKNGFQEPSLYSFYSGGKEVFVQTDIGYRRHQYDLWDIEENLFGREVVFAGHRKEGSKTIETPWGEISVENSDDYFDIGKLAVRILENESEYDAGQTVTLNISLENQFNIPISTADNNKRSISLFTSFREYKKLTGDPENEKPLGNFTLQPGEKMTVDFNIKFPEKPGKYQMIVSAKLNDLAIRNNGRAVDIVVR